MPIPSKDVKSNGGVLAASSLISYSPTPAAAWRKTRSEGHIIILPSGNKATIRTIALDQLVKNGKIPDFLTPLAAKSLWGDTEVDQIADNNDINIKFIELIDFIVPLALVAPKVVENPLEGKEEISIEDIEFTDKVAIFNLAIQNSNVLKSFRKQQEESLAGISDNEDN